MISLNAFHRLFAVPILLFIVLHLVNHLFAMVSLELHIAVMEKLRVLYRNPIVEFLLIVSLLFQLSLGLYFTYKLRGQRRGFFEKAQVWSGLYLCVFIIVHVSATFNARYNLGLDTNFYFASAGMHLVDLSLFFVPYYLLAISAVFTHIACAVRWQLSQNYTINKANTVGGLIIGLGVMVGLLVVLSLNGAFYSVNIPADYKVMF